MYGLRSSPKAWQEHVAKVLTDLGLRRLQSEPNVYTNGKVYIMVYLDDLLFIPENLMRKITNKGDHFEVSSGNSYIDNILQEANPQKATAAVTTGSNNTTLTTEQEELLDTEEHAHYRRMVGKLQWLSYTRPDMSFAVKELARSLQQPTVRDRQQLRHCLRYLAGTQHHKFVIQPTVFLQPDNKEPLDLTVYTDADWAGCQEQKVNQATEQGVKYMCVAFAQQEYNTITTENGTLDAVEHTHHNTGFTSWNCSFHDALMYMTWCIMAGVVAYTPAIYMLMFVPDLYKIMSATYNGQGKGFNRGFVSLMYQHERWYTMSPTGHGSQRVLRITVDWMRALQQYSYTRGYIWNQYIPLDVQQILDRPASDPIHAA
eukprot:s1731_g4.t2